MCHLSGPIIAATASNAATTTPPIPGNTQRGIGLRGGRGGFGGLGAGGGTTSFVPSTGFGGRGGGVGGGAGGFVEKFIPPTKPSASAIFNIEAGRAAGSFERHEAMTFSQTSGMDSPVISNSARRAFIEVGTFSRTCSKTFPE